MKNIETIDKIVCFEVYEAPAIEIIEMEMENVIMNTSGGDGEKSRSNGRDWSDDGIWG